ncbi:dynein regulatory complex subunit 2 [Labrus mixtus]|uniref:dynein regulatory complex subunit 2 n=1 Tax=Labrus mixtus TaxID=508554 RepID=UPI0029C09A94|nr:dynein regulatory complex subunit 2 [Labrus mixtus]
MPKKSKKGGGGKDGGRTEGERLLFQQQRAQAEEEMAKKKEEMLTLFLKDKLQKEERNTAVNLLKLNDGWRSILRQTRSDELRKDIVVMQQSFERQLDAMDNITKNLLRDLQESERQSAQVHRAHLQRVDSLWAQQDKRLMFLHQRWEGGLQQLSSNYNSDKKQMLEHFRKLRAELEDAEFTLRKQHEETISELHEVYGTSISAYNDISDTTVHHTASHWSLSAVSSLCAQKAAILQNSKMRLDEETLKQRRAEESCRKETMTVEHLQYINRGFIQSTETSVKDEKMLKDSVVRLKEKLSSSKKEHKGVELDLLAATDQVKHSTHQLRDQLMQSQKVARKQLTDLTVQSDNAAKKLRAVIAKGEKVLRVAEMCRRLESKILLTPPSDKPRQEPDSEGPAEVSPELRHVTRRLTSAVLQREALKRHKDDLSGENQQLRLLLRQHLDGMTVSEQHMDQRHALLTVYPAPIATAPPDTRRCHTVIEAVHAVKHSLR